jgi:EAL domain-containing protein (putative c-di-GMP-specific phosphodiesterase class I)
LSNKDEGVLHAIVALGRGLGMDIIAEGVETAEQLRWLKAAGYTHAQGYFLGMPTPTPLLALQLAG